MINFEKSRWERVRKNYSEWWAGKATRPVIGVIVVKPSADGDAHFLINQSNVCDRKPPEQVADGIFAALSRYEFYGDAYPMFNFDCFGPGVLAAFLGATLDNSSGRVWFHPKEPRPITGLSLNFDRGNEWFTYVSDIYRATAERFQGTAVMGMTDLGGVMDVLSTFRPGEELLYDLYDEPDSVKKLTEKIREYWHEAYDELSALSKASEYGYSDWSTLYSEKPSYILQSDFSYMIGNDMFREFVLDDLKYSCRKLTNTVYHLDGVGELNHLDDILSIKELNAVQWIPGIGNKQPDEWPEIYSRIVAAGKCIQLQGTSFPILANILRGTAAPGLFNHPLIYVAEQDKDYALSYLKNLGVEL